MAYDVTFIRGDGTGPEIAAATKCVLPHRDDPTAVGTSQVADAVIAKLQAMPVRA